MGRRSLVETLEKGIDKRSIVVATLLYLVLLQNMSAHVSNITVWVRTLRVSRPCGGIIRFPKVEEPKAVGRFAPCTLDVNNALPGQ